MPHNGRGNIFKLSIAQFIVRLLLGGIFIYASLDKIAYPEEFAKIVQNYNILPGFSVKIVAYLLPWIELILGIFLISGLFIRESAFSLSFLLLVFMIIIGIKSLNGTHENCGCFSNTSPLSSSNMFIIVLRDAFFLLCGILLIITNRKKTLTKNFI